jgi:cellulose synthase/poly-beta-1,6-N-acetylglucosamine synthase-like glycosyltransferase
VSDTALRALDLLCLLLALPVVSVSAYLAALAVSARQTPPAAAAPPRLRFSVIVPAHDEESTITETVRSLLGLAYPSELYRVVVVADNCRDRTAERARQAGARVMVRDDAVRRGKGHALAYAFDQVLVEGHADAVVVVDADTVVDPGLLSAFAARFQAGASAVQARYGVRNPAASWRTSLMALALGLFHVERSAARERLGLSCGLRGNGMGFTCDVLRRVPHRACSIVEDVEYGVALGLEGHRVHYVAEARVLGEMPSSGAAARSQRRRWEGGRLALARTRVPPLLALGLKRRDPMLLDLAMELMVPPLAYLALACVVGTAWSGLALSYGAGGRPTFLLWAASAAFVLVYVARGWALSGVGARGLLDLACAPYYLLWKISMLFERTGPAEREWVRTSREARP